MDVLIDSDVRICLCVDCSVLGVLAERAQVIATDSTPLLCMKGKKSAILRMRMPNQSL